MRVCGDSLFYFHYLDIVFFHPLPSVFHRDQAISMFIDLGTASPSELACAHGLSLRTVARAVADRRQLAADLLAAGQSLRQVAATLGVSHQTVYRYRRAGRLPPVPDAPAADPPPPPGADQSSTVGRSERNQLDAAAPLGMATCNVAGRRAASLGGLGPALPCFAALETVAKGGVLTALPALLRVGLLDHLALLGPVPGYYGPHSVFLLLAFLLLARVLNPERLRYEQPGEWGRLQGLDRSCAPDTLRHKLGELAVSAGAVAAWREALTRQWLDEAAREAATLFVDGHVQVYTAQARLPKRFVSRARLQLPAAAGYWVHAPGGMPLLCLHKQVDAGMVAELRTAVVPQLEQLGLLEPRVDGEPSLTLAFDREGWSPELLRDLQERGIACVTWCKGRQQERWHDTEFREAEFPLRPPARAGRRAAARAAPAGAARRPARPAGGPAADRLPRRDRPRGGAGTAPRQARGGARPDQGAAAVRRQPAARPRGRHAHRAVAAHRLPGPRRGSRRPLGGTQSHPDRLSRHGPATRLRDAAPCYPRKPFPAFQELTLKCDEDGKSAHKAAVRRLQRG